MTTTALLRRCGIVPLFAVAATLGACGGGGSSPDEGVASLDDVRSVAPGTTGSSSDDPTPDAPDGSPPTTAEPRDPETALLEFAACMRSHGVDMPDPQITEEGGISMHIGAGPDGSPADLDAAHEACEHLMPSGPMTRDGNDFDPTEMQDEMLAFTRCMREHGVDMPDPQFDEDGRLEQRVEIEGDAGDAPRGPVLAGPFGVLDLSDPDTEAAFEICAEDTMFALPPDARRAVDAEPPERDQ